MTFGGIHHHHGGHHVLHGKRSYLNRPRSIGVAYLFWFFLGLIGFHRLYLRQKGWFFLYFFTAGIFGFGWLFDLFYIPHMVREYNDRLVLVIGQGDQPAATVAQVYQSNQDAYSTYQQIPDSSYNQQP